MSAALSLFAVITLTVAIAALAVAIITATWLITSSSRSERAERVRAYLIDRLGDGDR